MNIADKLINATRSDSTILTTKAGVLARIVTQVLRTECDYDTVWSVQAHGGEITIIGTDFHEKNHPITLSISNDRVLLTGDVPTMEVEL